MELFAVTETVPPLCVKRCHFWYVTFSGKADLLPYPSSTANAVILFRLMRLILVRPGGAADAGGRRGI